MNIYFNNFKDIIITPKPPNDNNNNSMRFEFKLNSVDSRSPSKL